MRKPHDEFDEFPLEEVRKAIRTGIIQAEVQTESGINKTHSYKRKKGKRKIVYALGSVLAAFGILVISSHQSPALANSLSKLPIIGSIFGNSKSIALQKAHENGLTSEIGETQTVNGISVTLNEILYDQNNITIGLIIESDKQLDEEFYFDKGIDFTINGKLPAGYSGGYGEDILSETTRTAIYEINLNEDMPDKFDLGLILHGKNGETWYFSTPVEQIDIHSIPVNYTQNVDGLNLTVTDFTYSKTGVGIAYESTEMETDFDKSLGGYIEFKVVDQDGTELTGRRGGSSGELVKDRIIFKSIKPFDPLESHVTELTITPYLDFPTDGGGVEFDENGNEVKLEFTKEFIQSIEFEPFKVKIP